MTDHAPLSREQDAVEVDSLLSQFVSAEDPSIAEACLDRLLSEHAEPVIRRILRRKFASGPLRAAQAELQDEDDICHEVVFQLLRRLRALRESKGIEAITNFRGYVSKSTQNAYNGYLRDKHPTRHALKNQIRYLISHRPLVFSTWESASGELICGMKEWTDPGWKPTGKSEFENLAQFLQHSDSKLWQANQQEEVIQALFNRCKRPVLFDDLVDCLSTLAGVHYPSEVNSGEEDEVVLCELLPDLSTDVPTQLDQSRYLARLWQEVCQLVPRQRIALLLNLRDSNGGDALILFTVTGVTNVRRIADVLEIKADNFADMWNQLPLDDNAIAQYMGVTRQQVINLRKSARERLARRMAIYSSPPKTLEAE